MNAPREVALPPLVVDLDGTLVRGDLLHESALRLLLVKPFAVLRVPGWLAAGKAHLKRRIAEHVNIDVGVLPFDDRVLALIERARANGRRIVLCTASDAKYAEAVAAHLGCFDEVIASDGEVNVSAARKAALLTARFGERGFDYVGNSRDDLAVWAVARRGIVVSAAGHVAARARRVAQIDEVIAGHGSPWSAWSRALRLHQWLKNVLIFLPLVGAHRIFEPGMFAIASVAFFAFGLCASAVYVLNDVVDIEHDRHHPRKRQRPFAAGLLSPVAGIVAATGLLAVGFGVAWMLGQTFAAWLLVYLIVTTAYTFWLKRELLLDAIALAALYTLRIVAGGAAVGLAASFWLLAFSLFLFLSLAFIKRYCELHVMAGQGRSGSAGRSYLASDLQLIETLGVASGFAAVLVMALYLNSDAVLRLYRTPELMWLTIPLLLYWISRMWLQAHRLQMDDDPLLHALRDRTSLACAALFVATLGLASMAW